MIELTSDSKYTDEEFDKHDRKMSTLIDEVKDSLESAENKANLIIDKHAYPTSYIWRDIANLALKLADEEDWFDRYFDRNSDYHD